MNPTVEPLLHSAGGDIVGCGLRFARYRRRRHCWAEPEREACLHLAANTTFGRTCSVLLAAASAGSRSDHRIAAKQTTAMGTIIPFFH